MKKRIIPVFWIVMLVIVFVTVNAVNKYDFYFFGYNILFSTIIYPLVYFCCNRITQKSSTKTSIIAVILALLIQLSIFMASHYLTSEIVNFNYVLASLLSFLVSLVINIMLYNKFVKGKGVVLNLFLIYITVIIINHFILNNSLSDFVSILLKIFIALILVLIESLLNKNIS